MSKEPEAPLKMKTELSDAARSLILTLPDLHAVCPEVVVVVEGGGKKSTRRELGCCRAAILVVLFIYFFWGG